LIYTDDPEKVRDDETPGFNIGLMKKFQNANQPAFANVEFTLLSRNVLGENQQLTEAGHAREKLTASLLAQYQQVWFFGVHLSNLTAVEWEFDITRRGGPESELTDPEVDDLRVWMGSDAPAGGMMGGVLVSGDHSEPKNPTSVPGNLPDTLSLGRALGRRVPRAHQLRIWEGGPRRDAANSYNTQESGGECDLNDINLEGDPNPQKLILPRSESGCPHPLFIKRDGKVIDVFPDHIHEGKVIVTDATTNPPDADWPSGGPEPVVVAYGTDKRKPEIYKIVAVYDGDSVNVGRIASDSTWHHFFNNNLTGFDGDASPDSVANRLGQYYSNLAVWLSPLPMRRTMARAMFWWLAYHPLVAAEASGGVSDSDSLVKIGKIAGALLASVAGPSEIQALLSAHSSAPQLARAEALRFPTAGTTFTMLPSQELVLGSVIKSYYQVPATGAAGIVGWTTDDASALIDRGVSYAFRTHAEQFRALAEKALSDSDNLLKL
jgi:hypothetical protein